MEHSRWEFSCAICGFEIKTESAEGSCEKCRVAFVISTTPPRLAGVSTRFDGGHGNRVGKAGGVQSNGMFDGTTRHPSGIGDSKE